MVGGCRVLLALIGQEWLSTVDAAGRRRLEDPNDLVRLEIEAALRHNALVVPVLIDGTTMPRPHELPGELAQLAGRNARSLDDETFDADTDRLLTAIDQVLHPPPPVESPRRADPSPAAKWSPMPVRIAHLRRDEPAMDWGLPKRDLGVGLIWR
jgi:hypothetical protein